MKLKLILSNKISILFTFLLCLNNIIYIYPNYIILPFKTEQLDKYSNNFIQSKFDLNLHTYLELGKPKQKIKIYFRDEFFSFFIIDKDTTYEESETKNPKIPPENIKQYISSLYDPKLSSTYKNISYYQSFFIDIYYRKGFLATETFYLILKI